METYTLNRFYFEAKALLEKYSIHHDDYSFDAQFSMEENGFRNLNKETPALNCSITYRPKNYNSTGKSYYACGATPALCLSDFEYKLREATGRHLIESVGTEIPE